MTSKTAIGLISVGGGIAAGGAVHSPYFWAIGPIGLFMIALAYTKTTSAKGAAAVGWLGGFAYYASALPFLLTGYAAIGMTGAQPIIGVNALYLMLSMWWPVAFALSRRFTSMQSISGALVLSILWACAEVLRSTVFPAIPVAQIASILSHAPIIQLSRVVGVELLGAFILSLCVFAAFSWHNRRVPAASLILYFVASITGTILGRPTAAPELPHIASIPTAIPQDQRWSEDLMPSYMADLAQRTQAAFNAGAELVVWPEVAVPYFPDELRDALADAAPPEGAYLALGLMIPIIEEPGRYYNSLLVLDSDLNEIARYDKRRLFPFGEYIPFAEQLERYLGLSTIAAAPNAIAHGHTDGRIALPGLSGTLIAQICYEGSYSVHAAERDAPNAYIVNISNDAWWAGSSGGRFVEQEARLRAIEAGLPLIRIPNMSPASRFDAQGRPL